MKSLYEAEAALPPSPELDSILHLHVMGAAGEVRPYSTDLAAAWQVVETILRGGDLSVSVETRKAPGTGMVCSCTVSRPLSAIGETSQHQITAEADTAPLAICRAALLNENR